MSASSSRYLSPLASSRELSLLGEPFFTLQREVNRMFDDLFRTSMWPLTTAQQAAQQVTQQMTQQVTQQAQQAARLLTAPRLDVEENDDELCITTDLPGVEQSDVEVKVEGNTLTICGERKSSSEQKQENFHLMERSRGRFERTVLLPFASNAEQAEAHFDNGVLTIRLPKQEQQRSRRIEVKSGQDQRSNSSNAQSPQNSQSYSHGQSESGQNSALSAGSSSSSGASGQGKGLSSGSGLSGSGNSSSSQPSASSSSGNQGSSAGSSSGKSSSASSSDPSRKQPQPA